MVTSVTLAEQPVGQYSTTSAAIGVKVDGAVVSYETGLLQVFSKAVVDGVQVRDIPVSTLSSFSMMSAALYKRLPSRIQICTFEYLIHDIVGVGGASAKFKNYIYCTLQIAAIDLSNALLIVTDVLGSYAAVYSLGDRSFLRYSVCVCSLCLELRVK